MPHEIIERSLSGGGTDKRVQIDTAHPPLLRTISIGSNWTKLRVCAQISSTRKSIWSPGPKFWFGLCAGQSAPPGSATPNHFCGMYLAPGSWVYYPAGSNAEYVTAWSSGSSDSLALIANGSYSVGGGSAETFFCGAQDQLGNLICMEYEKGSPWSVSVIRCSNAGTSYMYQSLQGFIEMMQTGSRPSHSKNTVTTFTPDESTYGNLDTICFATDNSTDPFEISNIGWAEFV